jgi:hypothetical protein
VNTTELGSFLARSDRSMITIQSAGVDVYETDLVQDLNRNIANAGIYQLAIAVAQPSAKVRVDIHRVPPRDAVTLDVESTVVCDHVIEFYDALVTIEAGSVGTQGQFVLPDGPGRYRVLVTTDTDHRAQIARQERQLFTENQDRDPYTIAERLHELDGHEWYQLTLQYDSPIPNDEDDEANGTAVGITHLGPEVATCRGDIQAKAM